MNYKVTSWQEEEVKAGNNGEFVRWLLEKTDKGHYILQCWECVMEDANKRHGKRVLQSQYRTPEEAMEAKNQVVEEYSLRNHQKNLSTD